MPVNPLGGWTAASLMPALAPVTPRDPGLATRQVSAVPAPGVGPQTNLASPLIQNMLAAIYGPNFQGLLNTGQYQPPQQQDPTKNPAYIEANAYAQNLAAKNTAMHAYDSYQSQLNKAQQQVSQFQRPAGDFGSYNPAYNAAVANLTNLQTGDAGTNAMRISQAAALSPSYAPTIFQSTAPGMNPTQQWNPYAMSGWISPVQSGFGPMNQPTIASSLMSMGA